MDETKITPTQQRKLSQIAIARCAIAQLTALNKTLAQAELAGVRIDLTHTGYNRKSLEITQIFDTTGKDYKSLYKKAFDEAPHGKDG